jgi:hypothetical protein
VKASTTSTSEARNAAAMAGAAVDQVNMSLFLAAASANHLRSVVGVLVLDYFKSPMRFGFGAVSATTTNREPRPTAE